ncbi:MAG: NAD(P)-dependent alcohol dehydrogenase [Planctomycetaceae bacterium]|nr:NAD(P)-dependent alcohol dehydrogenase [Planctomycetaceae bacterium]
MQAYRLESHTGLDALRRVDLPDPTLAPDEILVRVRANAINYRDLSMPLGGYPRNDKIPLIPLSDAAGEVIDVGSDVTEFKPGDRVANCFFRDWIDGDINEQQMHTAHGGGIDGVLAQFIGLKQHAAVHIPAHLSFQQAATLPCAAVTAWQALTAADLNPDQTILTLGTGGVSIFALQLAKTAGARVIITSSSDEKLDRARALGADLTINYKTHPDWETEVRKLTDGIGVDNVVELGGVGTLEKSLAAAKVSGTVSLIGILARGENPSPLPVLFNRLTVRGIYVGSRAMFQQLNRTLETHQIQPVIDQCIPFADAPRAYDLLQSAKHFGKIVIKHD